MGAIRPAQIPCPESQAVRARHLHRFASRLEEIWLAAGKPSYRDLERLEPKLPKSTTSDVLRGKTTPSDRFVRAFIRACRTYSQLNGWDADGSIFDERPLFEQWRQLQRDLRKLRLGRSRTVPEPAADEPIADEPTAGEPTADEPVGNAVNGCSPGCVADDADVVVIRRVLDALRRMNTA